MDDLVINVESSVGVNSLGRGYDHRTSKVVGPALTGVPRNQDIDEPAEGIGMHVEFNVQLIESTKQLAQALSVSASAAVQAGAIGGEGAAKFAADHASDQNSVYVLASIIARGPMFDMNAKQLQSL
jgi:hypothetical protein